MATCLSGHEALAGDKFCGQCGQPVELSSQFSAPPLVPPTVAASVTAPLPPSPAWPLASPPGTELPTGSSPRRRARRWSAGAPTAAVIAALLVLGAAAAGIITGATAGQGAGGQVGLSALAGERASSANRAAVSSTSTTSTTTAPPSTSQPPATVAPAPTSNATGVTAALGALAGNWTGHGGGVQINPDGRGQATFRAYRFCSDNPTPPCDTMAGSTVVAGGHAQFVLRPTGDASVATGNVLSSDDPEAFQPGFAITVHLAPGDVLLVSSSPSAQNVAYCGSSATPGACGA